MAESARVRCRYVPITEIEIVPGRWVPLNTRDEMEIGKFAFTGSHEEWKALVLQWKSATGATTLSSYRYGERDYFVSLYLHVHERHLIPAVVAWFKEHEHYDLFNSN